MKTPRRQPTPRVSRSNPRLTQPVEMARLYDIAAGLVQVAVTLSLTSASLRPELRPRAQSSRRSVTARAGSFRPVGRICDELEMLVWSPNTRLAPGETHPHTALGCFA
jgi:hypothetical protein